MKTIMIDLDDTIVSGGYLDIINEYLHQKYTSDDIDGYYFEDLLPDGITEDYVKYFYSHDVYRYVKILEQAKEVIQKLNEKYDVCICSAYIFPQGIADSYIHLSNKYKYLVREFSFLNPKNFIFTSRKDLVVCDIKIDDRLDNLKGEGEKLLYTAYHNKNISDEELASLGIKRVNNWKEIEAYLLGD